MIERQIESPMPMPLVLVVKKAVNNRSAFSVLGFTVLTANIVDFDILLQLLPAGRVLLYRRKH
jgi:hypothetical protein